MSQFRLGFSVHDVVRDDKQVISDIDRIKEWLNGETLPKLLDEQILIFLISAENDVQSAMKIIKGLYQMKQSRPDVFAAPNLNEDMRRSFRATLMCYLPVRHDESIIILTKLRENGLSDFDFKCSIKTLIMLVEATVFNGPEKGLILLVDGAGTTLRHVMKMKLNLLRMVVDYVQDYLPIRLTYVHLINASFGMKMIYKMAFPLLRQKTTSLLHLHSVGMDMGTFYEKWIPIRCLPKEYGGELDSAEVYHQISVEKLESLQWFFEAEYLQRSQNT